MIEGINKRLLSTSKFAGRSHSKDYSAYLLEPHLEEERVKSLASMSAVALHLPELDGKTYHLTPVFWEKELLGFLHVIEENRPLGKLEIASIQRIAAALAMELLVRRTIGVDNKIYPNLSCYYNSFNKLIVQ